LKITKRPFGTLSGGEPVTEYAVAGENMSFSAIDYGCAITKIIAPQAEGAPIDVCLGYDDASEYEKNDGYFGSVVGRYAGRIGGAKFTLGQKEYGLNANDGANSLHGGAVGFDKYLWDCQILSDGLQFSMVSPDMDEGYPGKLDVCVTYRLAGGGLVITYDAVSDGDTIINLTNHTYFNLSGHAAGSVLDTELKIMADNYLPITRELIPTGEISPLSGSPLDFSDPKDMRGAVCQPDDQILMAGGCDHTYALSDPNFMKAAAVAKSPKTGVTMEVFTTQPGMQFYTGNFITRRKGKGGAVYDRNGGFCLETQRFPDSPANPGFPSAKLAKGERFGQIAVYKFSCGPKGSLGTVNK
jgi:aldose 1-epimerase